MSLSECQICAEKFNKTKRKPIECILCDDDPKPLCCFSCFTRFLLNAATDPTCMFCKREVTLDFIYQNSTKTFIDEYNNYRFEMKFGIEKSRLPETQDEANRIKSLIRTQRELKKVANYEKIVYYQRKLLEEDIYYIRRDRTDKTDIAEKVSEIAKLNIELTRHYRNHMELQRKLSELKYKKTVKTQFIKACPADNCRGFLSQAHKCGTCEQYFCATCNEVKTTRNDDDHVCNEEMKATMELIKKDSKPCPTCAIMIFRVSGCPQMWCVQCHTAFNWYTGKIDRGYVHNPEYFRYLREQGQNIPRNPNDIVNGCNGRIPLMSELRRTLDKEYDKCWVGWYDYLNHVRWYVLPNDVRQFHNMDYSEYRIAYLNNEITLEFWKKSLKMKMKKDEIMRERFLILDMYCNVFGDLFTNLQMEKDFETFNKNALQIFAYTNEQMTKLNKKYGSSDGRYFLKSDNDSLRRYFV
jgi:hypothetical protein